MTPVQEDTLYEFLLDHIQPFSLKEVVSVVRAKDNAQVMGLSREIAHLIAMNRLAFKLNANTWLTRAGCFTGAKFVVQPTSDELVNGILIPGHRFLPFANPIVFQKEYKCLWKGQEIPMSDTEAEPEELYPYYSLFGEEFAPQFVARENAENEEAFNADPYEDPPEVSIKTFDMRVVYRESAFVPGDKLVLTVKSWRNAIFEIEKVPSGTWSQPDLQKWASITEDAFFKVFEASGPNHTIEDQIAGAYFAGGQRMRDVPAYPLEDFLYEKTDKIECVPFGIETRFWYAGKEIPDFTYLRGNQTQSDQTEIERVLLRNNIPVSEYVLQAYVYDALFRNNTNITDIMAQIIPSPIRILRWEQQLIKEYIMDSLDEFTENYSIFTDKKTGPLRQRACELHTAVINLSSRLEKGEIDPTWLPKHSFIILSQIQNHVAAVLEDLINLEEMPENEIAILENSLDSMIDTYDDIKEMIEKSLDNYRHSNITLVKQNNETKKVWRTIQIGIGGTDVWRRLLMPETICLFELHKLIQAIFGWTEIYPYCFMFDKQVDDKFLDTGNRIKESFSLADLAGYGFSELVYEYGTHWTVKIIILAVHAAQEAEVPRCLTGENAAPPEKLEGPLRFRRFLSSFNSPNKDDRQLSHTHLGSNFKSDYFDLTHCNKLITEVVSQFNRSPENSSETFYRGEADDY